MVPVPTVDPLGRPVAGEVLLDRRRTAYVESAQACGLHLLAAAERDPKTTTSYGLGAAGGRRRRGRRPRRSWSGWAAPATNDGGAGLLAALGADPARRGRPGPAVRRGGARPPRPPSTARPGCAGAALVAATDVDNPLLGLHGASNVFGPQKGADRADVLLLDAALERFAAVLEQDLPGCPPGLGALPGGGAAGGLGAALLALGGRLRVRHRPGPPG